MMKMTQERFDRLHSAYRAIRNGLYYVRSAGRLVQIEIAREDHNDSN